MGPGHAPNRDLIEALDRQTATGEILRAISQSQTDTQPVFEAIADSALRLFRAWSTTVYRVEGQFLHPLAAGGGRLASPFSAREVYRQEWTGLQHRCSAASGEMAVRAHGAAGRESPPYRSSQSAAARFP